MLFLFCLFQDFRTNKVYRVDSTTEELNAPYFSYKRNDGGHKCLAKTPTWQGITMTLFYHLFSILLSIFFIRRQLKIDYPSIVSDGRETNVRVRLPRGKYCIIPSTFQPDQEGDFILRVHIERYSREEVRTILILP